ncbi:hypothetical protein FJU30_05655 [Affinibrenneria salicis]|uniref:Outer membrane protein assembly factor BamE n=1 Tax=Affinibrenneria salicis TaxID=2590031 RepID=A0A5J5G5Q5_9GAMM|nr:hypothetical protein [Affinibrenneria salicis]KAA9001776.1 hypothetical protein FJU30_05655 [Affinibrenneria salicis]
MKKIAVISMLMVSSVLAGCASSGNKAIGNETETSVQNKITQGVTDKASVKAAFGSPDSVNYTDGGKEIWKYVFAKANVDGKNFIPFYGLFHNSVHVNKKELTILFNGDIVEKYNMSESYSQTKSGLAD